MADENSKLVEENEQQAEQENSYTVNDIMNYQLAQRYRQMMTILKSEINPYGVLRCTKEQLHKWIRCPSQYEKQLRDVSRLLYEADGRYRRLVNYQPNMLKYAYVLTPADASKQLETNDESYKSQYLKAAKRLHNMNIRTEANKLTVTANRDGIVYAYAVEVGDMFRFQILDPDYCRMAFIDSSGCIRFEFNFAYFNSKAVRKSIRDSVVKSFGDEFVEKYKAYSEGKADKWQELGENSICIKHQEEILDYSIPPYISVVDTLFDLEDYKRLAKAKEETGNYKLLNFKIPTDANGRVLMDVGYVKKFIEQATSEIPDTIGILYSPMETEKIAFDKDKTVAESSAVTSAEEQFWAASGVSELLFGSSKSSSNALSKSIIADEINIYPLLWQIERWINRRLMVNGRGSKFKIKFLDVTYFNDTDKFDYYRKSGEVGMPLKNAMAAAMGYTPFETLAMGVLENNVLEMRDKVFNQPLYTSSTMSSNVDTSEEGGRPEIAADDLTEKGEEAREDETNIRE
jgi:hypothetical protein